MPATLRDDSTVTDDIKELLENIMESGVPVTGLNALLVGGAPLPAGNYDWLIMGINALYHQIPLAMHSPITALVGEPIVLETLNDIGIDTIEQLVYADVNRLRQLDPELSTKSLTLLRIQAEARLESR